MAIPLDAQPRVRLPAGSVPRARWWRGAPSSPSRPPRPGSGRPWTLSLEASPFSIGPAPPRVRGAAAANGRRRRQRRAPLGEAGPRSHPAPARAGARCEGV